jgi:Domain of unknown function (DUF4388)
VILWGDIAEFPLFSVLQFLATQRQTGILEIQDFEEQGAVYLSTGRIEGISLAQADEDLGSRLVAAGALTETEVKECWMRWSSDDEGQPLLAHLLQAAHTDAKTLVSIVDRHAADQVMQLMYWSTGTFRFIVPARTVRFRVVPSISVENLLLDAYRRVDEGERPRREKVLVEEELCTSCTVECSDAIKSRYLKTDVCLWRNMPSVLKDSSFGGHRKKRTIEVLEDEGPEDLAFI